MVITIGREYGSGGKYIGEQLAERMNMKLYDKELIARVAEEEKIDINLLEANDEKKRDSFWSTALATYPSVMSVSDLSNNEKAFLRTSKVIEELAEKEDCIIIGRCSNVVLKDKENVVNVFIYASDMDFKVKRKMQFDNLSEKDTIKQIKKQDKERAVYYNYHTGGTWGDKKEYDICIDTSKVGIENTIKLIEAYCALKRG